MLTKDDGYDLGDDHDVDDGPDPDYARITNLGLKEDAERRAKEEAEAAAEAARKRAAAPSPRQKAQRMEEIAGASFLFGAIGPYFGIRDDPPAFKILLDSYLGKVAPADPIEAMLAQQLLLAHHAAGRLHVLAGSHTGLAEVTGFLSAAARLAAEVRKAALGLEAYRAAVSARAAGEKEKAEKEQKKEKKEPSRRKHAHAANGCATNGHARNGAHAPPDGGVGSNNRLNGYFNHEHEPAIP